MPPEILCPRGVPQSPHLILALLLRPLQPISPGEPSRELDLSAPTPDLRSWIATYQSLGGASEQRFSETLPCEDPFSIGCVGWAFPPLSPKTERVGLCLLQTLPGSSTSVCPFSQHTLWTKRTHPTPLLFTSPFLPHPHQH